MNPLVQKLYLKMTRIMPGGRSQCDCCQLDGKQIGPNRELVRHVSDCELAKLYESEGGQVEWQPRRGG